jgi:hypothetical protein
VPRFGFAYFEKYARGRQAFVVCCFALKNVATPHIACSHPQHNRNFSPEKKVLAISACPSFVPSSIKHTRPEAPAVSCLMQLQELAGYDIEEK